MDMNMQTRHLSLQPLRSAIRPHALNTGSPAHPGVPPTAERTGICSSGWLNISQTRLRKAVAFVTVFCAHPFHLAIVEPSTGIAASSPSSRVWTMVSSE